MEAAVVDRRAFIAALPIVLLAGPLTGAAPGKTPRIGWLGNGKAALSSPSLEAFREGLRELGWIEGQNVAFEYRWADGDRDRLPGLVADLSRVKVDVMVLSGTAAIRAARTISTVPVVFVYLADPVMAGFVSSLARPDGHMTGVASEFDELIAKQLQLLTEALPKASRIALLHRPEIAPAVLSSAETAARQLGLAVRTIRISGVATTDFDQAFRSALSDRAEAVHVLPSPFFYAHRKQLITLAARHRLPAVYEFKDYVEDGGLLSYGPSITGMYRATTRYVDRILKGARPGDLPIERPARFELVINLRTAKAIGLTIPQSLLQRADHVIE